MKYFSILESLMPEIDCLLKSKELVIIAIDGNAAAGKTTLAQILGEKYPCNLFHMDDFFLRSKMRTEDRLREIGGNVDRERFLKEVLKALLGRESFSYRKYNCKVQALGEAINIKPQRLNIVEGAYSLHPELEPFYDLKIFLTLEREEQEKRILKRDGPHIYKSFINEWIPKENKYFTKFEIKDKCHFVFSMD